MTPCFLCAAPAGSLRSLTQLTAPPAGSHDAVPICADCQQAWSFSLHSLIRADLAQETNSIPENLSFPRHGSQTKL